MRQLLLISNHGIWTVGYRDIIEADSYAQNDGLVCSTHSVIFVQGVGAKTGPNNLPHRDYPDSELGNDSTESASLQTINGGGFVPFQSWTKIAEWAERKPGLSFRA